MNTLAILGLAALLAPAAIAAPAQSAAPKQTTTQTQTQNTSAKPVVLDRVIAIVNNEVLLQSDVDQEQRLAVLSPLAIPHGQDTQADAARRLIRRTLVLEQMKLQDQPTTVSQADAEKGLQKLRVTLHGCAPYSCSSQQGWNKFLKDHGITQQEALQRWSQRLAIEKFINLRFRAGIHITSKEISTYYNDTLVPALQENQVPVPPLKQVAPRIEQLLIEQHVNSMISQWLQSLRAEGSVKILVPAYGKSTPPRPDSQ
ncbi:MAG: hypothetical protein ACP5M4_08105 [Acidobacteriaceae bacterium]